MSTIRIINSMFKSKGYGIKRILRAIVYSWQGMCAAFKHESAFRQELVLILITTPLLWLPNLTWSERGLLIGASIFILLVELVNSAIEAVVDLVTQEKKELAGRAKDLGSAAVFMAMVIWMLVWGVIVLPHVFVYTSQFFVR